METPLSTRRVTRSQTVASEIKSDLVKSKKVEESETSVTKSVQMSGQKQHQDRSALIDITNDSPIVGVAMGNLETPSSAMSKKGTSTRGRFIATPNSGEALLRGQVKNLLQKVEEEAEFSKICVENRPFFNHLQGLITANSPMISLVAPTPANTPQVLNFSGNINVLPPSASPVDDQFLIPQMVSEIESENAVTRSLLLDFSEKSELSECSSVLTYIGQLCEDTESSVEKSTDDDDASIWSIQAHASSAREDDDEEEEEEDEERDDDCLEEEEEGEDEGYGDCYDEMEDCGVDELCEGMSKIRVKEMAKFAGKHIRFVYNSDEELVEGEHEKVPVESSAVLRLRGLPTPEGFPEGCEEE